MAENKELLGEIIEGRRAVYGDPEETFKEHAIVWSVIFGVEVRPDQVALALVAYKMLRANHTPDYSDNIDDVIGYADIFKKVQGDNFINARTVDEYLEKKLERDKDPHPGIITVPPAMAREIRQSLNLNIKILPDEEREHLPERGCCDHD